MSKLSISIEPHADGYWDIETQIQTDRFSGRGGCYVDPRVLAQFATELGSFPMQKDKAATLELGFNEIVGDDLLQIRPHNSLGSLEVRVIVADHLDPEFRVKAMMLTTYEGRDRFARQIARIAKGEQTSATLEGD